MTKHHWIWTTVGVTAAPYDFDSFRVFTYVVRRHRYETAYIERNIEGYYPIEATPGTVPRFSLILREEDGKLYKKTWIMEGYLTSQDRSKSLTCPARTEDDVGETVRTPLPTRFERSCDQ